ncbi:hypothetical protein QA597_06305 [Marinilabiliaceae bacterium ANBcel2]|nr:hypothetical protein [Marinilabiliaceae bacterium ANBcel2]
MFNSSSDKINLPPREQLLRVIPEIFPGIDKVISLFRTDSNMVEGLELIRTGNSYKLRTLIPEGFEDKFIQYNRSKAGFTWLHKEQLPFEHQNSNEKQLQIFSEQKHVVLFLKLPSLNHEKAFNHNLFYLFFREDQSNFGISNLSGVLDTSRKAIIGSIFFNASKVFIKSVNSSREYVKEFTNVTRRIISEKKEDNSYRSKLNQWINEWAHNFANRYVQETGKRVKISVEAIIKLSSLPSFNDAEAALEDAVKFALMLYEHSDGDLLKIEEEFIVINRSPSSESSELTIEPSDNPVVVQNRDTQSRGAGKMSKTEALLDRLENAAHTIISSGEDPTGSSVGQMLDKPVSAPAITDALRKNSRRIILLLEKYPQKWPVLRKDFKPLTNVIEKNSIAGSA